jgi:cytochrome c biogenesis protein CcmG/thiol:disulfide interchange protein DsbE
MSVGPHDDEVKAEPGGGLPHPAALGASGSHSRRRRRRWIAVGAVVGSVAVVAALFGFGLTQDPTYVRSPLVGRVAPDFSLPALRPGGPSVSLSRLRGQVVVLNFWASWCTDCRIEHSSLAAAWQRYRDRGVVLVGIPFEDPHAASVRYAREMRLTWPLVQDPGSRTALAYGVYGPPETFVVAPNGRILYKQIGPVSYPVLTDEITRALSQRSP